MKEEPVPLRLPPCLKSFQDVPLSAAAKWKSRSKSPPKAPPRASQSQIIRNKLADQDNSFLNRTYTIDTNKREREKEFGIEGISYPQLGKILC
ncbi:hypothetical protein WR25_17339 [Diploscapter pachys]|uniref:Uncharacterized protein n=1 Tax=Diploscapter pachys TaxID=2018661 RepID=A0A2A2JN46_9BILA|nr:hypothetical protein WR25_17339 [Diploscapter pachys]